MVYCVAFVPQLTKANGINATIYFIKQSFYEKKLVRILNICLLPNAAPFRVSLNFTLSLMGALFLVALKKTTPTKEIISIVEFTILFMLLLTDLYVHIKDAITPSQKAANKKNPRSANQNKE